MPTTKYKTLRRITGSSLTEVGEVDANGGEQAIRKQLAVEGFSLLPGETLVAIPVSNWTEKGANVKTTTSFELTEPAAASTAGGKSAQAELGSLIDDALA